MQGSIDHSEDRDERAKVVPAAPVPHTEPDPRAMRAAAAAEASYLLSVRGR
jgi:hypothetical protein